MDQRQRAERQRFTTSIVACAHARINMLLEPTALVVWHMTSGYDLTANRPKRTVELFLAALVVRARIR